MDSTSICELPRSISIHDTESIRGEHKIHVVDLHIGKVTFKATFNEDYTFIHQEDVYDNNLNYPVYNKVKNDFSHRDKGIMIEYKDYKVLFRVKNEPSFDIKDCITIFAHEENKSGCTGFRTYVNVVDKTYSSSDYIPSDCVLKGVSTDKVTVTFR